MRSIPPSYEQKTIPEADKRGALRLVASKDGAAGSVTIHADARIYAGLFDGTEAAVLPIDPARKAYVHVVRGGVSVNGVALGGMAMSATADPKATSMDSGMAMTDTKAMTSTMNMGAMSAAYMTLENKGGADTLIGVSPAATAAQVTAIAFSS